MTGHVLRPNDRHFVAQNGREDGPYTLIELRMLVAEGRLGRGSLVYVEHQTTWVPLEELVEGTSPRPAPALPASAVPRLPAAAPDSPSLAVTPLSAALQGTRPSVGSSTRPLPAVMVVLLLVGLLGGAGWYFTRSRHQEARVRVTSAAPARALKAAHGSTAKHAAPAHVFSCDARKHVVQIDREESGFRYTAWEKPKHPPAKPSLILHQGQAEGQGSGACARTMWSFRSGTYLFRVEEAGCGASASFDGTLVVENAGRELLRSDCQPSASAGTNAH